MNRPNQNIRLFKEAFLLVLFFVAVFSFSQKPFGSKAPEQKDKTSVTQLSHTLKSTAAENITFNKRNASFPVIKYFLARENNYRAKITGDKTVIQLRFLQNTFLNIKPHISFVAYYRPLSRQSDPELL